MRSIMREHGICGLPRQKSSRRHQARAPSAADLVNRNFSREGPDRLWMTDITEHPTLRASCIAVRCSTRGPAESSAGPSIAAPPRPWSTPRWPWPSPAADRPQARSFTQTTAPRPIHLMGVQPQGPNRRAGPVLRQSRRRMRQRRCGGVLGAHADRVAGHQEVDDPRRAVHRHLRLDRSLLQSNPAPLISRPHLTGRVRTTPPTTTTRRLTSHKPSPTTGAQISPSKCRVQERPKEGLYSRHHSCCPFWCNVVETTINRRYGSVLSACQQDLARLGEPGQEVKEQCDGAASQSLKRGRRLAARN